MPASAQSALSAITYSWNSLGSTPEAPTRPSHDITSMPCFSFSQLCQLIPSLSRASTSTRMPCRHTQEDQPPVLMSQIFFLPHRWEEKKESSIPRKHGVTLTLKLMHLSHTLNACMCGCWWFFEENHVGSVWEVSSWDWIFLLQFYFFLFLPSILLNSYSRCQIEVGCNFLEVMMQHLRPLHTATINIYFFSLSLSLSPANSCEQLRASPKM